MVLLMIQWQQMIDVIYRNKYSVSQLLFLKYW